MMNTLELVVNYPLTEYKVKAQYRKLAKKYHSDVAVPMYANTNKFVEIDKAKRLFMDNFEYGYSEVYLKYIEEHMRLDIIQTELD